VFVSVDLVDDKWTSSSPGCEVDMLLNIIVNLASILPVRSFPLAASSCVLMRLFQNMTVASYYPQSVDNVYIQDLFSFP
jgi:hypothetical protein